MQTTVGEGFQISEQEGTVVVYIGPDEDGNDVTLGTSPEGALNIASRLIEAAGEAARNAR